MSTFIRALALSAALALATGGLAQAQTQAPASTGQDDNWKVAVYPIFVWVPFGLGIDVTVPPNDDGEGGGRGEIIDSRFDGAYLGGFYAERGAWRIDADGLWAAVGGDRPQLPRLTVDVDAAYFHATGGREIAPDLFLTAGIRRLALQYDIKLGDLPNFSRKPGVWDPLIGLGYHRVGRTLELHGTFEGGGFGVGSDVDLSGMLRFDWKPISHFGITAGYNILYFKVSDTLRNREFVVKQTMYGPILGIGFYF
jgi:hypothetical protein